MANPGYLRAQGRSWWAAYHQGEAGVAPAAAAVPVIRKSGRKKKRRRRALEKLAARTGKR